MEQVTIWPGEMDTPLLFSARAIKVISEVESQFFSSSSFSSPRSVPAGRSRISSICKRNSSRFIGMVSKKLSQVSKVDYLFLNSGVCLFDLCADAHPVFGNAWPRGLVMIFEVSYSAGMLCFCSPETVSFLLCAAGAGFQFRKKAAIPAGLNANPVKTKTGRGMVNWHGSRPGRRPRIQNGEGAPLGHW